MVAEEVITEGVVMLAEWGIMGQMETVRFPPLVLRLGMPFPQQTMAVQGEIQERFLEELPEQEV
jgi:hypothetical protein